MVIARLGNVTTDSVYRGIVAAEIRSVKSKIESLCERYVENLLGTCFDMDQMQVSRNIGRCRCKHHTGLR